MKLGRTRLKPARRRVFLGCEGESERSYGALLIRLLEQRRQDVHIDNVVLRPGGGDALTLVERAKIHIERSEEKGEPPYEIRALLLDGDLFGKDKERDAKARKIAKSINLSLIIQDPCHEGLLLHHLSGCTNLRPSTSAAAMKRLKKEWPEYEKAMSASRLEQRIDYNAVLRASEVNDSLRLWLIEIGFIT